MLPIHFLSVTMSTTVQMSIFWTLHDHLAMPSLNKESFFSFLFNFKNIVDLPSSVNVSAITSIS